MADFDEAKVREDFEFWFSDEGANPKAIERNSIGDYRLASAMSAWRTWKVCAATYQPSAPAWIADQMPLTAIHNAIRSLERDQARCVEWRDQSAQGSASFAFHNQAVAQCNADITALISLLPPAEQ